MPVSIHPLSEANLEAAASILGKAFQRPGDWMHELRFNRGLQPDGYFGAYKDGTLVGMVGATIYSTFAHVGLMGVHPEFQQKGIGLALMENLLSWLDQKNVPLILLDASEAGQVLYKKLGFVAVEQVFVLQRFANLPAAKLPPQIFPIRISDMAALTELDTKIFGANRSRLLNALLETYPGRGFRFQEQDQIQGYLFAQKKRVGPWVMRQEEGARFLLESALSLPYEEPVSVVVPECNASAIALLQSYSFKMVRTNVHMARGSGMPVGLRHQIFGQTSLSLG